MKPSPTAELAARAAAEAAIKAAAEAEIRRNWAEQRRGAVAARAAEATRLSAWNGAAVLTQVHEVVRADDDDLDLDPALAACAQL